MLERKKQQTWKSFCPRNVPKHAPFILRFLNHLTTSVASSQCLCVTAQLSLISLLLAIGHASVHLPLHLTLVSQWAGGEGTLILILFKKETIRKINVLPKRCMVWCIPEPNANSFSIMCCSGIIVASPLLYKHGKSGVDCAVLSYLTGNEHDAQRS